MAERKGEIIGNEYHLDNGEVLRAATTELLGDETIISDRRCRSASVVRFPRLTVQSVQTDIDKAGKDLWNYEIKKEDMGF